uniref:Uncharacterized protein n=1 Tax=Globodera rostochiensis TaxID=31243 RepID=A0A914I350_GLORO
MPLPPPTQSHKISTDARSLKCAIGVSSFGAVDNLLDADIHSLKRAGMVWSPPVWWLDVRERESVCGMGCIKTANFVASHPRRPSSAQPSATNFQEAIGGTRRGGGGEAGIDHCWVGLLDDDMCATAMVSRLCASY